MENTQLTKASAKRKQPTNTKTHSRISHYASTEVSTALNSDIFESCSQLIASKKMLVDGKTDYLQRLVIASWQSLQQTVC
jgi:hypothetical protein